MPTERGTEVRTCADCGISDEFVDRWTGTGWEHPFVQQCNNALRAQLTALQQSRDAAERDGARWRELLDESFIQAGEDGEIYLFCALADSSTECKGLTEEECEIVDHGGLTVYKERTHHGLIADPDRINAIWDANHSDAARGRR